MAKDTYCPLLKKDCIEHRCKWFTHIRGKHPQSGAELDMHDCAVRWLPVLLIESTQMSRQVGAAVESSRNEQVRAVAAVAQAVLNAPPAGRVLEVKA